MEEGVKEVWKKGEEWVREGVKYMIVREGFVEERDGGMGWVVGVRSVDDEVMWVEKGVERGLIVESGEIGEVMEGGVLVGYGGSGMNG